jgi:hypothetical protein
MANSHSESESEVGELSVYIDPNLGDLTMARMKLG